MKAKLLLLALALAGCATPPPIDPASLPATPAAFKEAGSAPSPRPSPKAEGHWWTAFHDPVLDDLVARADRGNTSIRVATARLAQARALLQQADADRLPQVGVAASVERGDGITVTGFSAGHALTIHSLGANASWEADLFGKLRRAAEAADLDAQASQALLANTRLVIEADVAQSYLRLRSLDEERAIVGQTVAAFRRTLDLTERRYRAGDVAELDVARASTQVAATEADALALDRQRAELEHAIAVLVGDAASDFSIEEAPWSASLPVIPA